MTIRTFLVEFWQLQSVGAVQYRTTRGNPLPYTDAVIPRDADTAARLERLIEQYRQQKHRQRLLRAIKLWRRTEADQGLASLELLPERVH